MSFSPAIVRAVSPADLDAFCASVQSAIDAHFDAQGYKQARPVVSWMKGRKYARIVKSSGSGNRSVYGFVDLSNGLLLKAASWKSPARNFSRGNLFDSARVLNPWSIS